MRPSSKGTHRGWQQLLLNCSDINAVYADFALAAYSSENDICALNQSLFVTSRSGYLANIITDETGQGSELCPWRFDLPPGHTVRLTLLDFGVWIDRVNRDKRNICRIYATIEEMGDAQRRRKTVVCGGMERKKFINHHVNRWKYS